MSEHQSDQCSSSAPSKPFGSTTVFGPELPVFCRVVFNWDRFYLVILGLGHFGRVLQGLFDIQLGALRWTGIFLTFAMIAIKFPGNHRLINDDCRGLRLAWVGLGLWVVVMLLRIINAHDQITRWAHPDSIFATHPEYAEIPIVVMSVFYNLIYVAALLLARNAFSKFKTHKIEGN